MIHLYDQVRTEAEQLATCKYELAGFHQLFFAVYKNNTTGKTIRHLLIRDQGRWRPQAVSPEALVSIGEAVL